jgi:hypothetical protein
MLTLLHWIILSVVLVFVLGAALTAFGSWSFQRMAGRETAELLSRAGQATPPALQQEDIQGLPGPVQRWLRRSGALSRPAIHTGRVVQRARMRLRPEQETWYGAAALQYTTTEPPAFIWTVDVRMNALLHFRGRDRMVDGQGEMLIKVNSLLPVVNEKGDMLSEGTLQRYLGELVWFPSLAASPHIRWEALDSFSARATITLDGTSGSGTFYFDEQGDFVRFSAMRYMENVPGAERHEWVLTVNGYKTFGGLRVPSDMEATWKLPQGDWTWLQLEIEDIQYNQAPPA